MGAMIDTNVLIFASHGAGLKPHSRTQEKEFARGAKDMSLYYESSVKLLSRGGTVRVSALTVVEFRRSAHDQHVEWFDSILPRLRVVPVDGEVAIKASELLRHRDKTVEKVCHKCLNSIHDEACGKCTLRVPRYKRINDAIIVASAEIDKDVEVLWSFDGPIRSFQPLLKACMVRSPFELDSVPAQDSTVMAAPENQSSQPKRRSKVDASPAQGDLFGRVAGPAPADASASGEVEPKQAPPSPEAPPPEPLPPAGK